MSVKRVDRIDKLSDKLEKLLKEDILERYHNSEYWEPDTIADFKHNNKLTDKEFKEVIENLR